MLQRQVQSFFFLAKDQFYENMKLIRLSCIMKTIGCPILYIKADCNILATGTGDYLPIDYTTL